MAKGAKAFKLATVSIREYIYKHGKSMNIVK